MSGIKCIYHNVYVIIIYLYKIAILHHGMQSFHINRLLHACRLLHDCWRHTQICDVTLQLQYHYASMQMNAMPIDSMFRNEKQNLMIFIEIDNFIQVYNNSVIELAQCFGTSFFGRIDHLASSVIKFRPKNSVPKHCIRSITYNNNMESHI